MKGITIGGVEYLPASSLAKQFRYTTDYIGQLCRAKKIDAQLVGRSWYINPISLTAHKEGRYANTKSAAKVTVKESKAEEKGYKVTLSRMDVEPVVSKNTVRMSSEQNKHFVKRIDWKPLKYEIDETALLPQLRAEAPAHKIKIDLAESTELAIKTSTKSTTLVAEELPTVSLKGKVQVASLDEDFADDTNVSEVDLPEPKMMPVASSKAALHHAPLHKRDISRPAPLKSIPRPAKVVVAESPLDQDEVESEEVERSYVRVTLMTVSGALACLLLLVLFAESNTEASIDSYAASINFSTESLTALFVFFSR